MAFLLAIFPLMSTIPNPHHSFLVHLMNCYFPNLWYSHATGGSQGDNKKPLSLFLWLLELKNNVLQFFEILHILLMSMEIPSPQSFSELLTSGNFVI